MGSACRMYHPKLEERIAEAVTAFSDNLRHADKDIHVSTLKILSHYKSLCEENFSVDQPAVKKRKINVSPTSNVDCTGSNPLLLLLSIETTPISISTSRSIQGLISKLQMDLYAGRIPNVYALVLNGSSWLFQIVCSSPSDSTPSVMLLTLLLQALQKIPADVEPRSRQFIPLFLKFLGYNTVDLPRLLEEDDPEIQLGVLDCLSIWKDDYFLPYTEQMRNFISSKHLREELTTWSLSGESEMIEECHQPYLVPLVIRLLMPKVRKLKGLASRKKASICHRKAILIAGLDVAELPLFFALLINPLLIVEKTDGPANLFWNLPIGCASEFRASSLLDHFTSDTSNPNLEKEIWLFACH